MATTNDQAFYERLLLYRDNGIKRNHNQMEDSIGPWHYEVCDLTGNYHLTDFQAALGLSQLKRLDQFVLARRHLLGVYRDCLKDCPYVTMSPEKYDSQTAYHLCVVRIDFAACGKKRAELMEEMKQQGIGTQVHYIPLYHHRALAPFFKDSNDDFPQMEAFYSSALSLPLYADLKESDVKRVCETLISLLVGKN